MRHTGSILIVDDDERNLEIICHLLEGLCLFETAGNGEEALEKVKHSPPDLVLLDIMMPGIDGYAACREIKLIAPHTKVILVSAKAMVEERGRVHEQRVRQFLDAGYTTAQVFEVVMGIALKTLTNYSNHLTDTRPNPEFVAMAEPGEKVA